MASICTICFPNHSRKCSSGINFILSTYILYIRTKPLVNQTFGESAADTTLRVSNLLKPTIFYSSNRSAKSIIIQGEKRLPRHRSKLSDLHATQHDRFVRVCSKTTSIFFLIQQKCRTVKPRNPPGDTLILYSDAFVFF